MEIPSGQDGPEDDDDVEALIPSPAVVVPTPSPAVKVPELVPQSAGRYDVELLRGTLAALAAKDISPEDGEELLSPTTSKQRLLIVAVAAGRKTPEDAFAHYNIPARM